jgi:hypothetical protein
MMTISADEVLMGEGEACTRVNLEVGRDRVRGTHGDGIYVMACVMLLRFSFL